MDERLTDAILDRLHERYVIDGEEVRGQSISFLQKDLQQSGWKGLGNLDDFRATCERLGFEHKQGKAARRGHNAWVITL